MQSITSEAAFAAAAREYSASPSAPRGGALDWVKVSDLPPGLAQILLQLAPGQVTQPLPIPNGIALFQLREVQDGVAPPKGPLTVDYALYLSLAAARPRGAGRPRIGERHLQRSLRRCAPHRPRRRAQAGTTTMDEVPADVGMELAKLDHGEITTDADPRPATP